MKCTYAYRLIHTGWQGKNITIKAGGWFSFSAGMFKRYIGDGTLGWKYEVPSVPQDMLRPAPRGGYVEGQYAAVLFNYPLNCSLVPSPKAFQLMVDELEELTPALVSMPGGVLLLQLKEPVGPDRQVTLHYFPPAKQPLQDEDGIKVEAFTLNLKNLGEHAAADDGGITWSASEKLDINETGNGSLKISWAPVNENPAFYRLMVFINGELKGIYESPKTFFILEEIDPDGEYEFLVVGVDAKGKGLRGSYAQWRFAMKGRLKNAKRPD